jgi:murein DD-endopeptidase MepM/ murein hydrolase activator NlpD
MATTQFLRGLAFWGAAGLLPLLPVPAQLNETPVAPASPPLGFDRSLEQLEREGVITRQELQQRQAGSLQVPQGRGEFNQAGLVQLCSRGDGAVSRRDCASATAKVAAAAGVTSQGRPFRISAEGLAVPPLTVPVEALLAGGAGGFSLSNVLRVTPRPLPLAGNGNRSLLFPLIGSALTTSSFGWRLHPILGSLILHSGSDFAAPEGTPVVAALAGRVVSSGLAGGYGLAVELEHGNPRRRTLYGHLSELFVQAGERVRQGEVIGRVGSTGLSTGPHLHFELRQPEGESWVAVDPGQLSPSPAEQGNTDLVVLLLDQLLKGLERPGG